MQTQLWSGRWRGNTPAGDTHKRSREIVLPTGGIMRGKFPSRKNGRVVHHEGLLELDAIYLFEISPQISRYREQPDRYFYPDGDRVRRYTPDFELHLFDGTLAWVEIKPTRYLQGLDIAHRFECVAEHMGRNAKPFTILTELVLRQEPRQTNVRTIWQRADRVPLEHALIKATLRRCAGQLPACLADATALLSTEGMNVFSLMLQGYLQCDLDKALCSDSLITLSTEAKDGWFWLSQEHRF
ncbi:MAG: transposase [Hyphomicrobiales bacterium]|nr:MAG: transposase [Hyphomicrobiales bacterium]